MDSVARGTAINLATRVLAMLLVLVLTTLAARIGTEAQGVFALFTSVEGLLLALLSGFGVALARRVSHHREQPRALLAAMLLVGAGLGLVAALGLWGLSRAGLPAYRWLWLLALAAPLLLLAPTVQGLWLGAGRMGPMAHLTLAPPLLALLLVLLAWALAGLALPQVLASWVLAKVVVGLVAVALLWRAGRLAAPDFAAFGRELPFVATIGLTNLIGLLNYRVGLFVVERLLGLSATGVYSIAVICAELLWFVSGSLTQAAYGRIGHADQAQAAATALRVAQLGVAALVVMAPLLWLLAQGLLPALLGEAYRASLLPLLLLLPGVMLFGAASALSAYFTNHAGAPQVSARVAALSLGVNGVLACLLVPLMGMAGAALAATLAYSASVLLLAWRFARHAGLPLTQVLLPGAQLRADLRAVLALRRG